MVIFQTATNSCAQDKKSLGEGKEFHESELGFDAARTCDAPAARGFKNSEQSRHHKNQSQPQQKIAGDDDAHDEANGADDTARHAAPKIKIPAEEAIHGGKNKRGSKLKQAVR